MTKKAGRPTKLTPKVQEIIVDTLKLGCYECTAAEVAGIDHTTMINWKNRGAKESSGIYFEFLEAVTHAMAFAEGALTRDIRKAGKDDWRAAAWLLERRHKDRWAKMEKQELSNPDGTLGPVKIEIVGVAPKASDGKDPDLQD